MDLSQDDNRTHQQIMSIAHNCMKAGEFEGVRFSSVEIDLRGTYKSDARNQEYSNVYGAAIFYDATGDEVRRYDFKNDDYYKNCSDSDFEKVIGFLDVHCGWRILAELEGNL